MHIERYDTDACVERYDIPTCVERCDIPTCVERYDIQTCVGRYDIPTCVERYVFSSRGLQATVALLIKRQVRQRPQNWASLFFLSVSPALASHPVM